MNHPPEKPRTKRDLALCLVFAEQFLDFKQPSSTLFRLPLCLALNLHTGAQRTNSPVCVMPFHSVYSGKASLLMSCSASCILLSSVSYFCGADIDVGSLDGRDKQRQECTLHSCILQLACPPSFVLQLACPANVVSAMSKLHENSCLSSTLILSVQQ